MEKRVKERLRLSHIKTFPLPYRREGEYKGEGYLIKHKGGLGWMS